MHKIEDMSYTIKTIRQKPDYEGEVTATLITKQAAEESHKAVLYVHGFIDYFFQDHMADAFTSAGYNFYAIDLRKYGRSMLIHQHPNYCRDINEYFEDIDAAFEAMIADGNTTITLLGHSTGGLLSSIYASRGRYASKISLLVLNSPFFEFNVSFLKKQALLVVSTILKPLPYLSLKGALSPLYAQSVHQGYKGEWNFNLEWKPIEGFPSYFRWMNAIWRAHKQVHKGLLIQCPVLVMHSKHSSYPKEWNEDIHKTDVVLNVSHIKKYGKRLGKSVSFYEVPGGMHDLVLSPKTVRDSVMSYMVSWIDERLH